MFMPENRLRQSTPMEVGCCDCGLYGLCCTAGLNDADFTAINQRVHRAKKVMSGEVLVYADDSAKQLFAVKSGMFKAINVTAEGDEQVVDFHLPGELMGLEAISEGRYSYTIMALENSRVL